MTSTQIISRRTTTGQIRPTAHTTGRLFSNCLALLVFGMALGNGITNGTTNGTTTGVDEDDLVMPVRNKIALSSVTGLQG